MDYLFYYMNNIDNNIHLYVLSIGLPCFTSSDIKDLGISIHIKNYTTSEYDID